MRRKTKAIIAGSLTGIFAYTGLLWSQYPDNQQLVADKYHEIAVSAGWEEEKQEIIKVEVPPYITAGLESGTFVEFMPPAAASACTKQGDQIRLIYQFAIIEDQNRTSNISHPRVNGDPDRYESLLKSMVHSTVSQTLDKALNEGRLEEVDLQNITDHQTMNDLLLEVIQSASDKNGLSIGLRISSASGFELTPAYQACTPKAP